MVLFALFSIHFIHFSFLFFLSLFVFFFLLLDGIRNIVIDDDVGLAINDAYVNIIKAKSHLNQNNLIEAIHYARQAFESSERAFFDPSLLALLYFPDDQK